MTINHVLVLAVWIVLIASLGTGVTSPMSATAIQGFASVIDGDTIEIRGERIRLDAIDAPESSQLCLDAAGLLQDPITGRKRCIYSFRYTYATLLASSGRVSPAELGANMGTSLPMIDRHYYHFDPKKAADRLADTMDDR